MTEEIGEDTIVVVGGEKQSEAPLLRGGPLTELAQKLEGLEHTCGRIEAKGDKLEAYLRMIEKDIEDIKRSIRFIESFLLGKSK
jgi:hypothetical protein